jgi:hypothetical protein
MLPIVHQPDHHQHQGQYQNPEKENKRALSIVTVGEMEKTSKCQRL